MVARSQHNDKILFGEYLVDYLCLGIKNSSYASDVSREGFLNEVIPFLYMGEPPLDIDVNLAHEIVWGAVEYAQRIGFDPPRDFQESSRILEPADALPRSGSMKFGHMGAPLYRPFANDNQAAIIGKLIEVVGLGNFYYVPNGDIPEDVMELMEIEGEEEASDPAIWTPGLQQGGGVDAQSGLWFPGQQTQPAPEGDSSEQPLIWTPGRS